MNTTQSPSMQRIYFQWYDHLLFALLLLLSIAIGIYFNFVGNKKQSTDEYFLGNKKMFVFPIAMSLIASHLSSITLTAVPADVYQYGATYALSILSIIVVTLVYSYVYLPVFYQLKLKSTYEYLSMRFNTSIRKVCSCLFYLNLSLYISIILYVPSLAYSQATGMSVYYVIPIVSAICTFYTAIGGLKAVVWTDTLQFCLTIGAVLIVFILGLIRAGGIGNVFGVAAQGGRLTLDFDFDLTARETVYAVFMHWTLFYLRMTTGQECVLKFLSLPTLKKAQQSMFIFGIGILFAKALVVLIGLVLFTLYKDCDPLSAGLITKHDQLVPFYVADIALGIPGLTGLFISGVFCTGLSSLSAALNSLSAAVYQDFVADYFPEENNPIRTAFITKLLVVLIGTQIGAVAMLVTQLGPVLPLAISICGVAAGSFVGLFTLGMLCPRGNSKGALSGILSSTIFVGWMFVGAQWYKRHGYLQNIPKHLTTQRCFLNSTESNQTTLLPVVLEEREIFYLYRISHYYYTLIGVVIFMFVGIVVSYATEKPEDVPEELLSPIVHFMCSKNKKQGTNNKKERTFIVNYSSLKRANQHMNNQEIN